MPIRTTLLVIMALIAPFHAHAVDEPEFQIVEKAGKIEIRQYAPMIVAEVAVDGDMRAASREGFYPLFRYITGNNTQRGKIDMTAPVTRTPVKIDMTAPVTRTSSQTGEWTIAFVMPADWSMQTLPLPNDPSVSLRKIPGELVATIRFAGSGREATHMKKQLELETWLEAAGYRAIGEPRYAGYNAPGVPGPFRRNEVMIPVAKR